MGGRIKKIRARKTPDRCPEMGRGALTGQRGAGGNESAKRALEAGRKRSKGEVLGKMARARLGYTLKQGRGSYRKGRAPPNELHGKKRITQRILKLWLGGGVSMEDWSEKAARGKGRTGEKVSWMPPIGRKEREKSQDPAEGGDGRGKRSGTGGRGQGRQVAV